ncbi:MAG: hypothetical protein QF775_01945 [archaeon]|nr:hypothetical protein [archaeon]
MYYKTDPFVASWVSRSYAHTNNWEILEMVRILNQKGYWVDILDRNVNIVDLDLKDQYDLCVCVGDGNPLKNFAELAKKTKKAKHILYTTGIESQLSRKLVAERYVYFHKRHPNENVQIRRMPVNVNLSEIAGDIDAFFCIGNEYTMQGYEKHQKPMYRIHPSSSPVIETKMNFENKDPAKFLYFGGNGNLEKGLDLVVEAILGLSDVELYICAPEKEAEFNGVYRMLMEKASNIHSLGFIQPGGKRFHEVTEMCGFIVFPASSEGTATSVTTCMRRGMVPVVTRESGIDIGDFGITVPDVHLEALREQMKELSGMSKEELVERAKKTQEHSEQYTEHGFSRSFKEALESVL